MEKKNVIVLFTGGVDSTYLVYKNLKEGNNVKPVYFELLNNENKSIVEKQNIEKLRNKFLLEFDYKIERIEYFSKFEINGRHVAHFPQPYLWLFNMIMLENWGYDEIQVGYVQNDDAISFLSEIKSIFNNRLFDHFVGDSRRNKLKFPLIKTHKSTIINDLLPKHYLIDTSSCENPIISNHQFRVENGVLYRPYKPCGVCVSCKKIKNDDYYHSDIMRYKYGLTTYKSIRYYLVDNINLNKKAEKAV